MHINTLHFSVFTYQNWCRNVTFSNKLESHRNYLQIKWFSILRDINKIRKEFSNQQFLRLLVLNNYFALLKKKRTLYVLFISIWGEIRGSNPCITEPQSAVLTTSPISPCHQTSYILTAKLCLCKSFSKKFNKNDKLVIYLYTNLSFPYNKARGKN